ncbi:hypothetical protein [Micromonospora wenchangensis]|uniref:hypothetical protein n=1 Tax=Micromonospora wenchangensis TaxID=1185415 RepID=UPI00382AD2AA
MSAREVRRKRWQARSGLRTSPRLVEVAERLSGRFSHGDVEHARKQGFDDGYAKGMETGATLARFAGDVTGADVSPIGRAMVLDDLTSVADAAGVTPDSSNLNQGATVIRLDAERWRRQRKRTR